MGRGDAAHGKAARESVTFTRRGIGLELCRPFAMLPVMNTFFLISQARYTALAIAFAAVFSAFPTRFNAADNPDTTGWKDLFGADFSGAVSPGKWTVTNGELVAGDHATLWTKESYGNFVLDLDFKVAAESNSGVFLRVGDPKNVLSGLEIQVHDSTDGTKYGMVGAIYDAKPPTKNMSKPIGEWNHSTITCKDSLVTVVFNGEEVIHADLNDWPEAKKNPDGTPNKFPVALKDF